MDGGIGHRIQQELIDARKFRERACQIGRELAELDVRLAMRPGGSVLARIRSWLRPLRALVELGAWCIAWLLAGLRSENKRLPARARALWGIAYCRARLNPSLSKAPIAAASTGGGRGPRSGRAAR